MDKINSYLWQWNNWDIAWNKIDPGRDSQSMISILLIHGFGACKEHWRYNQPVLGQITPCYAIDLIGFGNSSQPIARLKGEPTQAGDFSYCFENWSQQITDFCRAIVPGKVLLIGNSIGGVIALRASQLLKEKCCTVVLIDCAQRTMDDKRLNEQAQWMQWTRPLLKELVRQRWLSKGLFNNAANPQIIKKVLMQAYPTGKNVDDYLINLLHIPSKRQGASEAFRGFINLFDDYLAPLLLPNVTIPIHLIWGEKDPWEPLEEAQRWFSNFSCIESLNVIPNAGHCPHDENPEKVNSLLLNIIQQAT